MIKRIALVFLPLQFLLSDSFPANAACGEAEAIGWYRYTNNEVGQISRKIKGKSWSCGNVYSLGNGFKSDEFSASWGICIHKEICGEKYLPQGSKKKWIYGSLDDSNSIGSYRRIDLTQFSKEGHLPLFHYCVMAEGSDIEYCWKDINYVKYMIK